MEKEKIIQLIEQELVQADEAKNDAEFEKHIYAIHTLTSLVNSSNDKQHFKDNTYSVSTSFKSSQNVKHTTASEKQGISPEEIQAMGGKIPASSAKYTNTNTSLNSNKLVTDDEIGNGDSIFDF
ncbi:MULTISPECIES: DUF5327 family protein [Staphylococcus]|uniref:DUF5327 family protein n=1 Tax=Staphylococcus TaxID=1279 RepID=UPI000D1B7FCF|nr:MULTISPECIES: DUF5327 family protein [Staphylococcus]MBA1353379.1 hypothetical protein [Staphylococcus cohnii]MBA1391806.1 hypothetical protein [Staphylococcus cohnii]MBB2508670.1 hypothetical protein [Staphylococcus cohnii subsp. barensis]MCE5034601.1 DUF5327 family protein [Staphylococcus cohnii]MCE5098477.1 DUF5327 family protein [Staphylococcus cohnii]